MANTNTFELRIVLENEAYFSYQDPSEAEARDGLHTFKTPQAIRSISARPLWGSYPANIARKCVQLRQPFERTESLHLDDETSVGVGDEGNQTEGSGQDEGPSSNWFEPNVVGNEDTNAGSGDEEWKVYGDFFMSG
ncbi:hypothetical protein GN244_ATG10280 [Phytophthora infestans]|uniref:Uncharacterized protein n=1 Tax=Phytophthora infestans TaxID=4787 RepID=A0A833S947_PHYIN|nr:hypothetical protein GN244_ATG10280 [Phytophthora infestans]